MLTFSENSVCSYSYPSSFLQVKTPMKLTVRSHLLGKCTPEESQWDRRGQTAGFWEGQQGEECFPDYGPSGLLPTGTTVGQVCHGVHGGNHLTSLMKISERRMLLLLNIVLNINQTNATKIKKHNYGKGEINFHNMLMMW